MMKTIFMDPSTIKALLTKSFRQLAIDFFLIAKNQNFVYLTDHSHKAVYDQHFTTQE